MTLLPSQSIHSVPSFFQGRFIYTLSAITILLMALTIFPAIATSQSPGALDVLVLSNGDTLHGKLVNASGGKVTFHSDALGDVSIAWDKIKELHTTGSYAVLNKNVKTYGKKTAGTIPSGPLEVTNKEISVHTEAAAPATIPLADAG